MRQALAIFPGKRILVTGHTGFKGSWLSLWLTELGAEVPGYALPPEGPRSLFNLLGLDRLIRHVEADVRDLDRLQQVFKEFQPEFLFHLAAQSLVLVSYREPKATFDTNVGGGGAGSGGLSAIFFHDAAGIGSRQCAGRQYFGRRSLNCDKGRRLLGWAPQWDFDRTVRETARWSKQVAEGEAALAVTQPQIADYLASGN